MADSDVLVGRFENKDSLMLCKKLSELSLYNSPITTVASEAAWSKSVSFAVLLGSGKAIDRRNFSQTSASDFKAQAIK
jgi:hypothetical protein